MNHGWYILLGAGIYGLEVLISKAWAKRKRKKPTYIQIAGRAHIAEDTADVLAYRLYARMPSTAQDADLIQAQIEAFKRGYHAGKGR